ncbi:MAG: hypothetical protein JWQ39_2682 [Glaciihabitans sp.]|jgi:hypothetical protein|nr:hypothetical protein [Glaciihabitans sp.]
MSDKANTSGITLGGEPRVNLLPPEVGERGQARKTRRLMIILIVIAVGVVIGAYSLAAVRAVTEQAGLDAANAKTAQILVQKQKYVSASAIAAQVSAIQGALKQNASTEVQWYVAYAQIEAMLPKGAALASGAFIAPAGIDTPLVAKSGLRNQTPAATLTLQVAGLTLPQAVDLMPQLNALPSFGDVTLDSVGTDHGPYVAQFTIDLTPKAYSGRFADGSGVAQ